MLSTGLLASCLEIGPQVDEIETKHQAPAEVHYVIEKGAHHATLQYEPVEVSTLGFKAKFDSSAIYKLADAPDQEDINKLMGLADCSTQHHTNSARFGWRWYGGALQIWAYCYVNGERSSQYMGNVGLGQYHNYRILLEDHEYVFWLDEQQLRMPRACTGKAEGYKLFPYFGGDEPAPHDVDVWVIEE